MKMTSIKIILPIVAILAVGILVGAARYAASVKNAPTAASAGYTNTQAGYKEADEKVLLCGGIPNGSTQNVIETTRLFINLPKDVYPDKEHNLRFKTVGGNATAGWISNGGPYGEGYGAKGNSGCWSYYYDFEGIGEVDLTVKSGMKNAPDYVVHFIVRPHPQDISTTPTGQ